MLQIKPCLSSRSRCSRLAYCEPYQAELLFKEKPPQEVIDYIKEQGFRWNGYEKLWARPENYSTQAQDRLTASRTYHKVVELLAEAKGVSHQPRAGAGGNHNPSPHPDGKGRGPSLRGRMTAKIDDSIPDIKRATNEHRLSHNVDYRGRAGDQVRRLPCLSSTDSPRHPQRRSRLQHSCRSHSIVCCGTPSYSPDASRVSFVLA